MNIDDRRVIEPDPPLDDRHDDPLDERNDDQHDDQHDAKRAAIHTAAIGEFSARGFAGTSMAIIAEAVGLSRPALYQYFRNKGDIFASAFISLLDEHVDGALAALDGPGGTAERLDGFLQRFDGDLWEQMACSPHSEELLSVKNTYLADAVRDVSRRRWNGLDAYFEREGVGREAADRRAGWVELLEYSPKGFKFDRPSVDTYRTRLTALARSVAADIDAST